MRSCRESYGSTALVEMMPGRKLLPTRREIEVLRLICDGLSTKQIAIQLGMSFKTAVSHRSRLMQKADAPNAVLLFRWAIKTGLVSL